MRVLSNLITSGIPNDAIKNIINNIYKVDLKTIKIGLFASNGIELSKLLSIVSNEMKSHNIILPSDINAMSQFEIKLFIDNKQIEITGDVFKHITLQDLKDYNYIIIFDEKDNSIINDIFITYRK